MEQRFPTRFSAASLVGRSKDPEDWWNAVCRGMHRLLTEHNVLATDVRGVGFSGQMHGLVILDAEKM